MIDKLYFSATEKYIMDEISSGEFSSVESKEFIDKWNDRGIKNIFLFLKSDTTSAAGLKRVEEQSHIQFHIIQPEQVQEFNNDNYLKLCRLILEYLSTPVAIIYDAEDSKDTLAFTAALLIYLKSTIGISTPEGAISYVSKREELQLQDLRVYKFKEYIDRTYQIPSAIKESFERLAENLPGQSEMVLDLQTGNNIETSSTDSLGEEPFVQEHRALTEASAPEKQPEVLKPELPVGSTRETEEARPVPAEHLSEEEALVSEDFKPSNVFIIRNKLITIITGIIVAALGTLIFLASYFYREDSEIRINEYSLRTTELVGKMIESEFKSMSFMSLNTATSISQSSRSNAEKNLFVDLFFKNNSHFVFLGIANRKDNRLNVFNSIINRTFVEQSQMDPGKFSEIIAQNARHFENSFKGVPMLKNLSAGLTSPLLGLSLPFGDFSQGKIVIVIFNPDKLQQAFQSDETGLIKTFMVDQSGTVIAHDDSRLVLAAENIATSPIVKAMLESKIDNGKIAFADTDNVRYQGTFKKLQFANLGVASTIEEESAFRTVSDMQNRNIYILIIVLFTAIIIVFFFSRTLSVPVQKLVGVTREIENGNYDVKIKPTTRDEIGRLTYSFSHMAQGLGEREKLKDAFGRFVNKEIAEQVQKGMLKLGGEKKECAIFFSDLRGFTAMSEKMSPEEVVEFLNEYFTGMVKCVTDTHGVVDKYIGDAVMAHWGAILPHGNNAENAVNGALMMREFLIEFNQSGAGKRPFAKFGCGINVGHVVAGQIGSEERMEYTVIGDAVNLASRIETLNKPFGTDILISEDTYQAVKDIFTFQQMPSITVKGKEEPQVIYAVLGRKDDSNCPRDMDEVRKRTGGDPPQVDLDNYTEEKEEKFKVVK